MVEAWRRRLWIAVEHFNAICSCACTNTAINGSYEARRGAKYVHQLIVPVGFCPVCERRIERPRQNNVPGPSAPLMDGQSIAARHALSVLRQRCVLDDGRWQVLQAVVDDEKWTEGREDPAATTTVTGAREMTMNQPELWRCAVSTLDGR